jgi:hypothetical protein
MLIIKMNLEENLLDGSVAWNQLGRKISFADICVISRKLILLIAKWTCPHFGAKINRTIT